MVHKEHKGGPPKLVKSATFHGITYAQAVEDNYALLEQIGQGAFGVVRKAVDKTTGALVCCKTIPRALLTANPEVIDDIKQEAKIMLHLRGHPNVVEVYGMFEDEDNIHIVQELCSGGDLKSKLTKAVVPPTEREASAIMHSILQVLEYCHSRQVLYRDVKPDNFLLSTNGPDAVLKATDFGISKILEGDETVSDDCGTPTYMSPEMHKSKYSGSDSKYGFPADIWAAGVTLYFVLSGVFPFKGKSYGELYQSICQTEPDLDSGGWDQVSAEAKDCIRLMLTKDPAKRPTATALLAHKWFKQASKHTKPLGNMVLNRMRAFAAMNNFKKEVIWLISLNLSEEYLGGLSSMFRAMDKDGDGFLSCAEVCEALERRGAHVDKKEVQEIISKINGNRNGSLDIFEFISAAMNQALLEKKDLLRHAFDDFDLDKDGAIGKKEAAAMLRKLGRLSPPAVDQTLAAIKFDAEGKLGFPEFCTLMSGTAEFQGVRNGLLHRVRTAVTEPGGILSTQQRVPDTVPNIQRPGEVRNTNLYTAKYQAVGSQSGSGHKGPHYAISPQHGSTLAAGSPRGSTANLTALSPHSSNGQPSLALGGGSGSYPSTSTGLLLLPVTYPTSPGPTAARLRQNSSLSSHGLSPKHTGLSRAGTSDASYSSGGVSSPPTPDPLQALQPTRSSASPGARLQDPACPLHNQHSGNGTPGVPAPTQRSLENTASISSGGAPPGSNGSRATPIPHRRDSLGPFAAGGASVAHYLAGHKPYSAGFSSSPRTDAAFAAAFSLGKVSLSDVQADAQADLSVAALLAGEAPDQLCLAPRSPAPNPPRHPLTVPPPRSSSPFAEAAANGNARGGSLGAGACLSDSNQPRPIQGSRTAPPCLPHSTFQYAVAAAALAAGGSDANLAAANSTLQLRPNSPAMYAPSPSHELPPSHSIGGTTRALNCSPVHGSTAQHGTQSSRPRPTVAELRYAATRSTSSNSSNGNRHRPLFERSDTDRALDCTIM